MSRARWRVLAAVTAVSVGLFAGGCDSLPTSEQAETIVFRKSKSSQSESSKLSQAQELELKAWEQREKDRVKLAQELSKPVYDSLKLVWERFLKTRNPQNPFDSQLLMCDPLQYTADVKIMGPEGGDMSIGPHKLSIPKGALTETTVITGELPVSNAVSVRLSPHGIQFAKDVKLTLVYKHCYRPKWYLERMVYTDELLNILEFPRSVDYTSYEEVVGWIRHFSRYAVAF